MTIDEYERRLMKRRALLVLRELRSLSLLFSCGGAWAWLAFVCMPHDTVLLWPVVIAAAWFGGYLINTIYFILVGESILYALANDCA